MILSYIVSDAVSDGVAFGFSNASPQSTSAFADGFGRIVSGSRPQTVGGGMVSANAVAAGRTVLCSTETAFDR